MGVWGLTTYIEKNCGDVFVQANIRELVEKYKQENNTDTAVILVNMQAVLNMFDSYKLNWICGGQMKEVLHITKDFVSKIEEIGAKLVFFDVGEVTCRRSTILEEREITRRKAIKSGFDSLKQSEVLKTTVKGESNVVCGDFHNVTKFIVQDMCKCELHHTSNEVDEEIANYAKTHNSFAILGFDSDFIIYNAAKYYLSLKYLDISTMSTMRYDSQELANHLRIHVKSLPLFATLVGNDVIRRPELEAFHKHICRRATGRRAEFYPTYVIIPAVADYVSYFPPGRLTDNTLADIAETVFLDKEKAGKIKESIESYLPEPFEPEDSIADIDFKDPDSVWAKTCTVAWNLRSRFSIFRVVYVLLKLHCRKLSLSFEDPRMTDLPVSKVALRPLIRRVYGVLLLEVPTLDFYDLSDEDVEALADFFEAFMSQTPIFPPQGKKGLQLFKPTLEGQDQGWYGSLIHSYPLESLIEHYNVDV